MAWEKAAAAEGLIWARPPVGSYRELLQHHRAIDILSAATLACSNAVDELGSHIYAIKGGEESVGEP